MIWVPFARYEISLWFQAPFHVLMQRGINIRQGHKKGKIAVLMGSSDSATRARGRVRFAIGARLDRIAVGRENSRPFRRRISSAG
jgi:hypothetical protein